MCQYCERRQDIKFGWDQPKLPYHNQKDISYSLNGNIADFNLYEKCEYLLKKAAIKYYRHGEYYWLRDDI